MEKEAERALEVGDGKRGSPVGERERDPPGSDKERRARGLEQRNIMAACFASPSTEIQERLRCNSFARYNGACVHVD